MRPAARLQRTPGQWQDHQAIERARCLSGLLGELSTAQRSGAEWYRWVLARAKGEHQHQLKDGEGRDVACPVPGCDAMRGSPNPTLGHRQTSRRRAREAKTA